MANKIIYGNVCALMLMALMENLYIETIYIESF